MVLLLFVIWLLLDHEFLKSRNLAPPDLCFPKSSRVHGTEFSLKDSPMPKQAKVFHKPCLDPELRGKWLQETL